MPDSHYFFESKFVHTVGALLRLIVTFAKPRDILVVVYTYQRVCAIRANSKNTRAGTSGRSEIRERKVSGDDDAKAGKWGKVYPKR